MYDAGPLRAFYDAYGQREWERFERDPTARVNFHIHRWYLERYVRPGNHVLDIGAGPGRFTIELARLGATVAVGDLSPVQLALNEQRVKEAGYESAVVGREIMDVTDLSYLNDAQFDIAVCFGGPLSYVFDQADAAVSGLLRVTKPGGYLFLSVMSLFGTLRRFLPSVLLLAAEHGVRRALEEVIETGNLSADLNAGHPMHLYRSAELLDLLAAHDCAVADVSAANFLSPGHEAALNEAMANREIWDAVLRAEVEACRQPGALDGGTHIIAVAQRLSSAERAGC